VNADAKLEETAGLEPGIVFMSAMPVEPTECDERRENSKRLKTESGEPGSAPSLRYAWVLIWSGRNMPADFRSEFEHPHLKSPLVRWRNFAQQWRHCYLLLLAVFWQVWRFSSSAIPVLENTRFMGGLHPITVLMLMNVLKLLWLFPLVAVALYVLSFLIRPLNTAEAIAASALRSSVVLAFVLVSALFRIIIL